MWVGLSQPTFRPKSKGSNERFGGGQTVRPLWGQMVTICKRLWGESLQCRMVRVKVSQCLNGGWPYHQGNEEASVRSLAPYLGTCVLTLASWASVLTLASCSGQCAESGTMQGDQCA
jgi:hypothetical protein